MTRIVRQSFVIALAAAAACARQDAGPDIRREIQIVPTAAGPRVSVYGFTPGMEYARAVERAGGDRLGSFFGAQGPIVTRGKADFGTDVGMMLMISEGRVTDVMLVFTGDHRALERIDARIGEALAGLPREEDRPGRVSWAATEEHHVRLEWTEDRGREELDLRLSDLALLDRAR